MDNKCSKCKPDFYLTNRNTCITLTAPIENCLQYDISQKCRKCKGEFILSVDSLKCTSVTYANKCSSYTPLKCNQCRDGFVENKNNYIFEFLTNFNGYNLQRLQDRLLSDGSTEFYQSFNQCQALAVPNCKVHVNHRQCVKCNPGYYQ